MYKSDVKIDKSIVNLNTNDNKSTPETTFKLPEVLRHCFEIEAVKLEAEVLNNPLSSDKATNEQISELLKLAEKHGMNKQAVEHAFNLTDGRLTKITRKFTICYVQAQADKLSKQNIKLENIPEYSPEDKNKYVIADLNPITNKIMNAKGVKEAFKFSKLAESTKYNANVIDNWLKVHGLEELIISERDRYGTRWHVKTPKPEPAAEPKTASTEPAPVKNDPKAAPKKHPEEKPTETKQATPKPEPTPAPEPLKAPTGNDTEPTYTDDEIGDIFSKISGATNSNITQTQFMVAAHKCNNNKKAVNEWLKNNKFARFIPQDNAEPEPETAAEPITATPEPQQNNAIQEQKNAVKQHIENIKDESKRIEFSAELRNLEFEDNAISQEERILKLVKRIIEEEKRQAGTPEESNTAKPKLITGINREENQLTKFMETPNSNKLETKPEELEVIDTDADITKKAKEIWESGNALNYMCESVARDHIGDKTAIRCMFLSYGSTRIQNSDGIHLSLSGSAGTGKSHTAEETIKRLPKEAVHNNRLSDKALFYHEIKPRTVIVADDQELTEDIQEIIKGATTNWNEPKGYDTIINGKPVTLTAPPICPFWILKANLNGDEQILDRQLVIWTDDSTEQRLSIQKAILKKAANPQNTSIEREDVKICRFIWQQIPINCYVEIPYAEQIKCDENMDPRNINLMISLIQSIALMRGPARQEPPTEPGAPFKITATRNDFLDAAKLFNPLLENKGGSQKLKLSNVSTKVLQALETEENDAIITLEEIQQRTGLNSTQVSQALHGRKIKDHQTQGLISVCPAIDVIQVSKMINGGTGTVRQTAIKWNVSTYKQWKLGSGMFYLNLD